MGDFHIFPHCLFKASSSNLPVTLSAPFHNLLYILTQISIFFLYKDNHKRPFLVVEKRLSKNIQKLLKTHNQKYNQNQITNISI